MGRKDTVTKVYMEQNNIFADAFNYMEMLDKTVNGNFRNLRKNEIDVLNQYVNAKLSLREGTGCV